MKKIVGILVQVNHNGLHVDAQISQHKCFGNILL